MGMEVPETALVRPYPGPGIPVDTIDIGLP
jgi:hypothetical protein